MFSELGKTLRSAMRPTTSNCVLPSTHDSELRHRLRDAAVVALPDWISSAALFDARKCLTRWNLLPPQLYTVHVIQAGGSDKTPAVITRRYSDFRRLHATLCRDHGALMERVCFPRKCCTEWRN